MANFTTLPSAHIYLVSSAININYLVIMWKQAVVDYFKALSYYCAGGV